MKGALLRFRVLAFVVGVLLLLLCAGMVLKYGYDREGLAETVSQVHGISFVLYLVGLYDLGRRVGWTPKRLLLLALAGVVPLLSFVVERRVARELQAQTA